MSQQTASKLIQYGETILQKIRDKGWNPYRSTNVKERGAENVLRDGPAQRLELGERYVIMPIAQDPANPDQVFAALERYALANNRQTPSIVVEGERLPWTGFIPLEDQVKVNTVVGNWVSYPDFVRSLETMTPASR